MILKKHLYHVFESKNWKIIGVHMKFLIDVYIWYGKYKTAEGRVRLVRAVGRGEGRVILIIRLFSINAGYFRYFNIFFKAHNSRG